MVKGMLGCTQLGIVALPPTLGGAPPPPPPPGGGAALQDSGVVLPLNPHVMFDILPEACRSGHSGEWVLMVLR
jgi:hypothetical protein